MKRTNGKGKKEDVIDVATATVGDEILMDIIDEKEKQYNQYPIKEGVDYIKVEGSHNVDFLNKELVEKIRIALEEDKEIRINLDSNLIFIKK